MMTLASWQRVLPGPEESRSSVLKDGEAQVWIETLKAALLP